MVWYAKGVNTTLTQQYERRASIDLHRLVPLPELLQELRKRGISVGRESELHQKLSNYARKGAVPNGLSRPGSGGSMVDHYPLWVADIMQDIDKWEKQGLSEHQVVERLSSQTPKIDSTQAQLNQARRRPDATGASQLANIRGLVRAGIKSPKSIT